jgi:hypothetical protein
MMRLLEWSLGWTKPNVGALTQPIGEVGQPTLCQGGLSGQSKASLDLTYLTKKRRR